MKLRFKPISLSWTIDERPLYLGWTLEMPEINMNKALFDIGMWGGGEVIDPRNCPWIVLTRSLHWPQGSRTWLQEGEGRLSMIFRRIREFASA